ncbi:MAG: Extracellular solute-binding protein [Candidatus Magasanikbacteria bacterium GW2011_GWC2_40_17]|uniref:Extracellular solute-binding protein n=1 Tax=Candidatus Magasanikbacteria bacterium GW2011_GWA2_42_32 TaxID=1619039 RepID=A0A0G1A8N5_9BACT|nr:MAG: Extracellular solute-binding protein [Candidatus Magasanikbacteria bacterium GW2011_GWC2_40_17]KKS57284.1 MAG: Extracellular solute-binding protein [Candidatus Magasanikbacteria bacterium GW2011_GWA2_42_32]OGH86172.1 MAG: hypothetical protein A2294_02875 [Candidatus Magasanikbacteria bacterium RIFOXYB2_FULL_38_10]
MTYLTSLKNWIKKGYKRIQTWRQNLLLAHKKIDQRLVLGLGNTKKFPSLKQLGLLNKFLTKKERRIIGLLSFLMVFSLVIFLAETYLQRRVVEPANGGEYVEGEVGYPNAINPLFSSINPVDADLSRLIYAGLFKYDKTLNLVPDLAEGYTLDKTGKIFTVKMRSGMRWQDGEPITIDDVAFTINSIQSAETQSPLWVSFQDVIFTKIDDTAFTLELPQPFAPFLNLLTTGILPEHLWQEIPAKNMRFSSLNLKPIGAGPFMFESFAKDSKGNIKSYTLKPNPNYQLTKPYLNQFTFKFFNDEASALDALKNHQINGLSFLSASQKEKNSRKTLTVHSLRLPYYTALFLNQRSNQLLHNQNLRDALELGIDKNQLTTVSLKGEGLAVNGPILPNQIGFTQDFKVNYNLDSAKKKLDDDKWIKISRDEFIEKRKKELYQAWLDDRKAKQTADNGGKPKKLTAEEEATQKKEADAYLNKITEELNKTDQQQKFFRQKNGYGLSIKITTINQQEFIETANLIKENWQDLGAEVTVNTLSNEEIKDVIKNRRYEVLLYSVISGADPDPFPFWHSSQTNSPGLNLSGFANRQADTALETARESYDLPTRIKAYYTFQKLVAQEKPAIFLYTSSYLYPQDTSLKGFNQYRIFEPADRFNDVSSWYLRTKNKWQW